MSELINSNLLGARSDSMQTICSSCHYAPISYQMVGPAPPAETGEPFSTKAVVMSEQQTSTSEHDTAPSSTPHETRDQGSGPTLCNTSQGLAAQIHFFILRCSRNRPDALRCSAPAPPPPLAPMPLRPSGRAKQHGLAQVQIRRWLTCTRPSP